MDPVHAVLRNWDILRAIMNFVKGDLKRWESGYTKESKDLVAIALVCRAFSDLALDVLWRSIDMHDTISLFPMDIIRVNPGGLKSLTRIPATPQQWERFDVYASRIRKLFAFPEPNDLFLRGVRMRHPTCHHPFPNLACLEWSSYSSGIFHAITIICPTLTKVRLTIDKMDEDEDADEDEYEDDEAVADILGSLGETCPRLRKFEYTHYFTRHNLSKSVETALIYLIQQCRRLEDVHLPVSRDILSALASLPHLWRLELDHVQWEDRSQLHLHIQADEWIEQADRFPALDYLRIQGSHTVSSLVECFQGSGCFPKKSLGIFEISEREQWPTIAIAEFFRGMLRPDRSEGLQFIRIDREIDVKDPVAHDPWRALRCLSAIVPNLQSISLRGLFLDINDMDLEEMSQIWPKLHSLSLEVPRVMRTAGGYSHQ